MAKAKKTETTQAAVAAPATIAVEVIGASSKKTKAVKAVKEVKASTPKVAVANTVVEASTEAPVEAVETSDALLTNTFSQFLTKLQAIAASMNSLKTEFRLLEKKATRELKAAAKITSKRKRKAGNRSPSGFVKPTLISDELAKFLSKPTGTEMARTEVTREINGYIRANNLQDKSNGRKINPDTSLATLLKITSEDELTYFNLQRYMSPHFAKATKALVAPAVTA